MTMSLIFVINYFRYNSFHSAQKTNTLRLVPEKVEGEPNIESSVCTVFAATQSNAEANLCSQMH